jgi:DNA-directed RNA polymerase specialized sigma24 family protein
VAVHGHVLEVLEGAKPVQHPGKSAVCFASRHDSYAQPVDIRAAGRTFCFRIEEPEMSAPESGVTAAFLGALNDSCADADERNEAIAALVARFTPLIQGLLTSRFHLQVADVQDAVNDLAMKIGDLARSYDQAKGTFQNLVCVCACRWALERIRKRKVLCGDSDIQRLLNDEPDPACQEFSSVLAEMIDKEMRLIFQTARELANQELTEDQRRLVHLKYDDGLTTAEAADNSRFGLP